MGPKPLMEDTLFSVAEFVYPNSLKKLSVQKYLELDEMRLLGFQPYHVFWRVQKDLKKFF